KEGFCNLLYHDPIAEAVKKPATAATTRGITIDIISLTMRFFFLIYFLKSIFIFWLLLLFIPQSSTNLKKIYP
ncbi:MAG: hypothetical protein ABIO05_03055, partial [Ferruginibacter sp.]